MNSIDAVKAIQTYIKGHIYDEDFSIEKLCVNVGYTRRHIDRLFKEFIGKTLYEYINSVLLSQGAKELLETEATVLDIALNNHFDTHEGFTRSFKKKFSISPSVYRESKIAIPMFIQYPINHYYKLLESEENNFMESRLCMITPVEKPERILIYLPSKAAADYLSYCQELGCEWEGLLNSIPEKLDTAALIELPDFMVESGYSKVVGGIEVPKDYSKALPQGYKTVTLPACTMLYFQSEAYENEEDFCIALNSVFDALKKYNPAVYGYEFAYDKAPFFNFGADTTKGARLAVPVRKIK